MAGDGEDILKGIYIDAEWKHFILSLPPHIQRLIAARLRVRQAEGMLELVERLIDLIAKPGYNVPSSDRWGRSIRR